MKFMGSKSRIAKEILPVILANRQKDQWYVEPFVGGGNTIDKVSGNRLGADVDINVIKALCSIRDSSERLPQNNSEFTEDDYKALRVNVNFEFYSYAGFAFSYGAKWMGGWRRDSSFKRDYVKEAYSSAQKQSSYLKGVDLQHADYDNLILPESSLIYCDPPYADVTHYSHKTTGGKFNYDKFWQWCRAKVSEGHSVFVSEYHAPDDFKCVWAKEITSSLTKDSGAKRAVEKLFTLKL